MNGDYIARALCFHGQPLQKIWEDERGAGDIQKWGVPAQPIFSVYQERQKHFTFQDRAKRLKLHQFFARKASDLYDSKLTAVSGTSSGGVVIDSEQLEKAKPYIVTMPPYEVFVNKTQDKIERWRCVLEGIKPGDIIYGVVTKRSSISTSPMMIKPLCTAEPLVRYLSDIPTKAYVQFANIGQLPLTKTGSTRNYNSNEFVCCEVLDISIDADRLQLGMEGVLTKNKNIKLGLVTVEEFPTYYRKANAKTSEKYDDCLRTAKEFLNPNYDVLYKLHGLDINEPLTLMSSLKNRFPQQDYAKELRQAQASKWAFRSVAEGIEHFKIGNHVEAFQCLNKALNIDPRNVEGLVARGALYANKGSFLKAVEDFEKALRLNSYHVNARKYMGETLVALGRSYEEDNLIEEAAKAYRDCLNIIPNHEQARLSLDAIQQRPGGMHLLDKIFNPTGASNSNSDRQKQKKRSTSSSSSSADNSSKNDSESSDTDSPESRRLTKEASLSPLSKRMAMHAATLEAESSKQQQFNQPFYMAASYNSAELPTALQTVVRNPTNEFKLDDDDTESRVQKLLQEASKHKKEKTKKSKKKKSKKSKKEFKEKETAAALFEKINLQEAYKVINGLSCENKHSQNLQLYEKGIAEIKKRQVMLEQSTSIHRGGGNQHATSQTRKRSETPPPKPPSMRFDNAPTTSKAAALYQSQSSLFGGAAADKPPEAPRFSFQIKRPVKVDKFGLVRIATPLAKKSSSHSRSHSHSRSRSRSPSPSPRSYRSNRRDNSRERRHSKRSRSNERHSRSRSRRSRSRMSRSRRSRSRTSRSRRSRSRRSRSRDSRRRSYGRSQSRKFSSGNPYGKRRTPSPFDPHRNSPSRRRRSRSPRRDPPRGGGRHRSRSPAARRAGSNVKTNFGNRVWQRPGYVPPAVDIASKESNSSDGRWLHDKFEDKADDGPSIEEIDAIINKAQKERKQEIISRDKDILRKPSGTF